MYLIANLFSLRLHSRSYTITYYANNNKCENETWVLCSPFLPLFPSFHPIFSLSSSLHPLFSFLFLYFFLCDTFLSIPSTVFIPLTSFPFPCYSLFARASYEVPLLLLNGISRLAASSIDIYRIESTGLRSEMWVDQPRCRRIAGDDGNVPPFPVNFLPEFLATRRRILVIFLCRVGISKLNKAFAFIRHRFLRLSKTVPSWKINVKHKYQWLTWALYLCYRIINASRKLVIFVRILYYWVIK